MHVLLEHSNRGKQSLGLDLTTEEGLEILYKLAATCDVFLTNKLPAVRTKLKIDVEDIRAHNPNIIYVRGTGQGERGPDADKGSYDSPRLLVPRRASPWAHKAPSTTHRAGPPAPAFGDSIGAMTIAGGIMGALFHRERTGEATVVDVSLLGAGMWSMGAGHRACRCSSASRGRRRPGATGAAGNPLVGNYKTKDGRCVAFACLQAAKYWPELLRDRRPPGAGHRPALRRPRAITANAGRGRRRSSQGVFAERTAGRSGASCSPPFSGPVGRRAGHPRGVDDPQTVANGYMQPTARRPRAPSSSWSPRRCSSTSEPAPSPAGPRSSTSTATRSSTDLGLDWTRSST